MDQNTASSPASASSESSKPLAFTIDFGNNKSFDSQRQKALAAKLQKRHKRGQSLSKIEGPTSVHPKQHPLTGNLPRKSSFQSDGYFSSDEKTDRAKTAKNSTKKSDLTLLLKNVTSDRMTQSFPNTVLPCITSPEEIELRDVSSPELDLISPFSPKEQYLKGSLTLTPPHSSLDCDKTYIGEDDNDTVFVDGAEFEFDKSDTVSDAGTYTLDCDNYSEEQKARMSIDKEFKIERVSVRKKTEEYIKGLSTMRAEVLKNNGTTTIANNAQKKETEVINGIDAISLLEDTYLKSLRSPIKKTFDKFDTSSTKAVASKAISPIMSPTQNISITQDIAANTNPLNNNDSDLHNKTFTKVMLPGVKSNYNGSESSFDQGSVISVTSSGAFKPKNDRKLERKLSLTKSEVQVQAYIDGNGYNCTTLEPLLKKEVERNTPKLTANIINVQSIDTKNPKVPSKASIVEVPEASGNISKISTTSSGTANLPPPIGGHSGKSSPTKIPSPVHIMSRPRSRNSLSSLNVEFSDSSLDTDLILKPTQNYIRSLQQRLSIDSDPDSDYEAKYDMQLNNTAHLLKQKASHIRHNSLDDRTINISNKLEHFHSKNFQNIDQTYSNLLNQYSQNKIMHKIQNSPNNSPIRRSSSFSTKHQINSPKNTNIINPQKKSNICNSPNLNRNSSIQRSSSTACINPNNTPNYRKPSLSEHHKIDRSQFGDTESSSEEDFEKNLQKCKDLANITNTRCNRAFSLRRARVDDPLHPKCPNTPEMRRKSFQPEIKKERAISVDRKPMKTNDVQSRYLLNISKRGTPSPLTKVEVKHVPRVGSATKANPGRPQTISRTDSGRFSMRASKPPTPINLQKGLKKDSSGKKQSGPRSNSSLSSREMEFQNWKRRKSYDPMKAAAEGKKKEMAKKQSIGQNIMTHSYNESNHSQDSSPSHSSSVHRSQSFHGTAALEQLLSSEEDDDLTLSADEGFSPPTPSPCELSPARASLRHTLWERIRH